MKKSWIGLSMLISCMADAQSPPIVELSAGMHRIEAEIAATPQTRQIGLMNRKSMPTQRGMLFVFETNARHCMWMRNTFIPLSVAFLDEQGQIINIEGMLPQTESNHCAERPARYALEMNAGWFDARGLKSGNAIFGIERVPQPR